MNNNNGWGSLPQSDGPSFFGPFQLHPTLHDVQMSSLTDVGSTRHAGLDTRKVTGLGIALCTDSFLLRRLLGRQER